MKSTAFILTRLAVCIVIAASFAACKPNTADTKTATPAATAVTKADIVFINQDTLLAQYDFVKDSNKKLKEKGDAASNDVGSKKQALQREYIAYQKDANTMSADQRAATEQRLQREAQTEQTYEQNASAELQNAQYAERAKFFDKMTDFLKVYAKEKGYKMILTYQKGNPNMFYGDPSLDITTEVVKQLNEAYAKDKK